MPGISRRPASSSCESSCGWLPVMSAPLRYARILNGFSPLISRRSAVSRRTRAIAALSNPQTLGFDAIVEESGAAGRQRGGNGLPRARRAVAEEAAAAARAADLGRRRSRRLRSGDEVVDRRRCDAGREPLAVVPLGRDVPADFVPIAALQ